MDNVQGHLFGDHPLPVRLPRQIHLDALAPRQRLTGLNHLNIVHPHQAPLDQGLNAGTAQSFQPVHQKMVQAGPGAISLKGGNNGRFRHLRP